MNGRTVSSVVRWVPIPIVFVVAGVTAPARAKAPPLEDDTKLIGELRRRGLMDMLDLLIKEHPPGNPAEAKLVQRAIRLRKANAPGLTETQKTKLLTEAVAFLEEAVAAAPDDPRRFDWRMDLGHDLLYQLAEPSFNNILFKGGTDQDRRRLLELAGKADKVFETLQKTLDAEYNRIDRLDPEAFERLASTGYVDRIERLRPLAAYFLRWARFYRALALPKEAPETQAVFQEVIRYMLKDNEFTRLDHKITGVQAQALWITGTAERLVGQFDEAVKHLSKAIEVVEKLPESSARDLGWVLILGRLEQVKARRDQGQFSQAAELAKSFRVWAGRVLPENFAVLEAVALLEGTIFTKHAETLRAQGDEAGAAQAETDARKPLVELARSHPEHQDRLYETVYAALGSDVAPASLDAFEKSAYVSGLLREAASLTGKREQAETGQDKETLSRQRNEKLDLAIDVGKLLLADESELGQQLRPNTLFTLAISYYQRGLARTSVDMFLELLRQYPAFDRAPAAAASAVQLAYEQMRQTPGRPDRVDQNRFVQSARAYLERHPSGEESTHWRLLLARTLEMIGETSEAAAEYDRIPQDHPHKIDARFLSLQLHVQEMDLAARDAKTKTRLLSVLKQAREIAEDAHTRADKTTDEKRKKTLRDLNVSATLMVAEVYATPALEQWDDAWNTLDTLEKRVELDGDTRNRALRIRILIRQRQGRVAEALQLALASGSAGSVVHGLLESVRREIARERKAGRAHSADKLANEAVSLAQKLYEEAGKRTARPTELAAITLSLAEAHLEAAQYEQAIKRFAECEGKFPGADTASRRRRTAVRIGRAEAVYQVKRYAEALPLFHELWRGARPDSNLWWRALLRNLQCHHALKHDSKPIKNSILQHRHRYPAMGGPKFKAEFDKLLGELPKR